MNRMKIGLLPLWLKLYDAKNANYRPRLNAFLKTLGEEFEKRGLDVSTAPICRIEPEFARAVSSFEDERVDAIVTINLAYSPSLEAASVLAKTKLPIIVLDTTPTYSYGPEQDPDELMYNHGIHGVQDMCNLLLRNGKPFLIEAGHWQHSDVLDRVVALLPAARMAAKISRAKVGILGKPFAGMGDFSVPPAELESSIGAKVLSMDSLSLQRYLATVTDEAVAAEVAADLRRFDAGTASKEAHERSAKLGLALRTWIEAEGLDALTFSFLDMERDDGYITAPFLEMSKALSRGTGYSGEGDCLTAVFVSALLSTIPETTFSEMFCPDWENGDLFVSHMGEANPDLFVGKACLKEMEYDYTDTDNPAIAVGRFKPGKVVLANLAPTGQGRYRLILAKADMLPVLGEDKARDSIHGWFKPSIPLADFLASYSRLGGTHHLAVCYGDFLSRIETFGRLMGWDIEKIG